MLRILLRSIYRNLFPARIRYLLNVIFNHFEVNIFFILSERLIMTLYNYKLPKSMWGISVKLFHNNV
ncbi:Uncharacterized protein dnm_020880 [Desulfonema magnum]|uniref:Uncharacterized protein n=1 Tax=Desulfonema magnum TaxID=45655 RepID=A0A975GLY1_9BACT|nr:Uncharacterized protein dnm_020880 [Desulfonema magnum]